MEFLVAIVVIVITGVTGLWLIKQKGKVKKTNEQDTVILQQVGRGPWAPSVSPFPLKLETFLRMANIPYKNDHGHKMSKKGKTPWIEYNGLEIADSQFCLDYLTSELGCDMNSWLSETQRATARAFQKLTEENLYWTMCAVTFGDDLSSVAKVMPFTGIKQWLVLRILRRVIRKQMWGHGIGRHSINEIIEIGRRDLEALSHFLGEKAYFMGEKPCEVDCAIFGMLAQIYWHMEGSPHKSFMKNEFKNLCGYCERMKMKFWPDWDDCISRGFTVTPTG